MPEFNIDNENLDTKENPQEIVEKLNSKVADLKNQAEKLIQDLNDLATAINGLEQKTSETESPPAAA